MLSSNHATFVRSLYTVPELPDTSFPVLSRKIEGKRFNGDEFCRETTPK
jgi:hypothetical protein